MNPEFHIDYEPICHLYAQEQLTGTLYLAFRDIPMLLRRFLKVDTNQSIKALDFGCGSGVSTRYLKSLYHLFSKGIKADGADVSSHMLELAQLTDPTGNYYLIQNGHIPVSDHTYDFVFNTFVLFEFATKDQMQIALEEIKRVMKKGALFIGVTGSVESYQKQNEWVSLQVNFPQNETLKSGDLGRVDFILNDKSVTFENYYWSEQDYLDIFQKAGFQLELVDHPLGYQEEEYLLSWHWKSELRTSPYYIFVLRS